MCRQSWVSGFKTKCGGFGAAVKSLNYTRKKCVFIQLGKLLSIQRMDEGPNAWGFAIEKLPSKRRLIIILRQKLSQKWWLIFV